MEKIEDIEAQVEKLFSTMHKRRIESGQYKNWRFKMRERRKDIRETIREHLVAGHKVKVGYMCTAIRGFREYIVLWKEPNKDNQ